MQVRLINKAKNFGFTMIELLIVIAILGILAVAVLSAINPVEQINRGRDTGMRSDAEQLLNAIDRYDAFQGYKPWATSATATAAQLAVTFTLVQDTSGGGTAWVDSATGSDCAVLSKLANGDTGATTTCVGSNEIKSSYATRISDSNYRGLFVYQSDDESASTYVCFLPQSGAFRQEAQTRCDGTAPDDMDIWAGICGDGSLDDKTGSAIESPMVCLP